MRINAPGPDQDYAPSPALGADAPRQAPRTLTERAATEVDADHRPGGIRQDLPGRCVATRPDGKRMEGRVAFAERRRQ